MNRAELRSFIFQTCARIAKWTRLSSRGERANVRGELPPADRTLDEEESTQALRLLQHFGMRSGPPQGAELIVIAPRGGPANAIAVTSEHLDYGPTDLEDGEVAVYGGADKDGVLCRIKLEADGSITIRATKAGANVTVIPSSTGHVRLGHDDNAGMQLVALYQQLKAEYDAFVAKFNGHTHVVPAGPGTSDPPIVAQQASALSSAVGAANVLAKKP